MGKSLQQSAERYAKHSARAFLEGKKNLAWATGTLRKSGLDKEATIKVLSPLMGYGDRVRAEALSKWLDESNW